MCAIAGIVWNDASRPLDRGLLQRMIEPVLHRGPDGVGIYVEGGAGLAHARLSIIDLHTGQQPLANENLRIWVSFNGEVFNYVELRAELESLGHAFRTRSDTETIVHAYEQYGDDFVHKLNGQFAIALWDGARRRLLLVRDRLGVRPLFYRCSAEGLYFASEIKSLFAAGIAARLDTHGLAQVFTFWSTVGSRTVFEGISSVPAGHQLIFENARCRIERYWNWGASLMQPRYSGSFEQAAQELKDLLGDAVRLQLRSDVPVGFYLSGGLDSSALIGLARSRLDTRINSFSICFEDQEFDETTYQDTVARHFDTLHRRLHCTRASIGEAFPAAIWHAETVILRSAPVPLMQLAGLVRDSGFKVILAGEGADEVFAGYDIFKEASLRRFSSRSPQSCWRGALFARLYPYLRYSPVSNPALAQVFFRQGSGSTQDPFFAHRPRWNSTRRVWNFFSPEVRAELSPQAIEADLMELMPPQYASWHELGREQWVEAQTLLVGYLLCSQGDRMAMAHSVEARVPFLDHRVVEFANRLPATFKLRGLREKRVLKQAMRAELPAAVVERPKQPYRSPDAASFFRGTAPLEYVRSLLDPVRIRNNGIFDCNATRKLVEKCAVGAAIGFSDNMAFLGILSSMLLDELFVRAGAASLRPSGTL